ncbi:MAG: hypothetical protein L0Y66_21105 [Myxococcaceae bacterium]|nr:hypothetical protein [Myxococcaceae bacterium]MCI0673092.1 hypothetical protein [Myxococcaceae bacterium]
MHKSLSALALLALLTGCEPPSTEKLLGITYKPLGGMRLREHWTEEESKPGGPKVGTTGVRFSRGLEFLSVPGLAVPVDMDPEDVLAAAGQPVPGTRTSLRTGRLHVGPVQRAEFKDATSRTLVYYAPLDGRGLLVRVSFPEKEYGKQVAELEPTIVQMTLAD